MHIERDVLIKYLIMTVGFVFAELLIVISDNIMIHVGVMVGFSILVLILIKADLLHPYTWFSTFFCLYSIGLPVLTYEGTPHLRANYSKELMEIQLLALFIILFSVSPKKIDYKIKNNKYHNLGVFNKILYVGIVLILIGGAYFLSRSGLGGKANIYSSGSKLLLAVFKVPLILTMLYTLLMICEWQNSKIVSIRTIVITGISLFGITIYSGERDFVFRFILITALFLFFVKKLKKRHMIALAPVAVAVLILSDKYKYFLSSGIVHASSESIISRLFAGEFEAASTNLQIVISQGMTHSWGLERYLLDFASAFTTRIQSVSSWFSDLFYAGRTVQYGFSIIGEGYVTGGVIGVILISIILGCIIRFFYKRSCNDIYWFAAYLYFITVVIYSIRMDIGTILSAIVKQIGLVLIIVIIAEKMSKQKQGRGKNEAKERLLDSNYL